MWVIAGDGTLVNLALACSITSEQGAIVVLMSNGETVTLWPAAKGNGQRFERLQQRLVPEGPDTLALASHIRHED